MATHSAHPSRVHHQAISPYPHTQIHPNPSCSASASASASAQPSNPLPLSLNRPSLGFHSRSAPFLPIPISLPLSRSRSSFNSNSNSDTNLIHSDILNAVRNIGLVNHSSSNSPSHHSHTLLPNPSNPTPPSPSIRIPTTIQATPSLIVTPVSSTRPSTAHHLTTSPSLSNTPSIPSPPAAPTLRRCPGSAPGTSPHLTTSRSTALVSTPSSSSTPEITTSQSTPSSSRPKPSRSRPRPPATAPSSSAHPQPSSSSRSPPLAPLQLSSIEPTIDYSEILEDIRNPPPAFTAPSHPPPPGHPPAAEPSDLSCGLLGRPNSPPPRYPDYQSGSSCDQRHEDTEESDHQRRSWNLSLSLDQRIAIWNARRNQTSISPFSPPTSEPRRAVHQSACIDDQTIWVPIRLVMDNKSPESPLHTQAGPTTSNQAESQDTSPSISQDTLQADIGPQTSASHQHPPVGSRKGKQVDRSCVLEPSGGVPRLARRPPPRVRRPPPLPLKPRMSMQPDSGGPPSTPTPLPASPEVVNQMLRRGSSLRRAPVRGPRPPGSREETRENDEEVRAFNRRSLPVLSELSGDSSRSADRPPTDNDTYGPFTELDLLLLRVEQSRDGTSYADLQVLEELLGGPVRRPEPVDRQALERVVRVAQVEMVARRVAKGGKVKMKLKAGEIRCNKCVVCLYQFKSEELVTILPCSHVFHEGCITEWVVKENRCPVCKRSVVELT